ncbi:hypothetical protein [Enhygromyxa salina]|uniref:Uncharacterized protein n=1 Tax=Enhygromyxa salina TaxID=215803 RepID=A0A2S9YJA9_9BACT|nr:hypothetical protein [Enhygromyxa salina]PRQ05116.1 hypothetical protein ENSA7_47450 [Enhygromyxa salina]
MPELSKSAQVKSVATEEFVEVLGGDGGSTPTQARLICNPQGTNDYYQDTRTAEGKLEIGRKLDME